MLVCGTLVYSRGDEVQSKRDHLEYEAHAAEEGEAQPSVLMPGQLLLSSQVLTTHILSTHASMCSARQSCLKYSFSCHVRGASATTGLHAPILHQKSSAAVSL